MGPDPVIQLIFIVVKIYISILLFRGMLQIAKADYYNPISQTVVRLTQVPLAPLQKILPKIGRLDFGPFLLSFVIFAVAFLLVSKGQADPVAVVLLSLINVLYQLLDLYFYAVIGSVIISWVAPGSYHPAPQLIQQVTEPLFRLSQKVIPPIGGLDLSPILIIIIIQLVQSQLAAFI